MSAGAPRMPGADGGQRGGAEHGRVGRAALDRRADRVGLQLEQQALVGQPAVDAQRRRPAPTRAIAATTSATRQAMPSNAARATCARVVPAVRPAIVPRASGRHHGAPTPVMPGSTRAPPLSGTAAGERAERGRLGREAELAAQPLEHLAGGEHAAVERVLGHAVDPPGDGGEEAAGRLRDLVADVGEHEHAGAVGRLDAPGRRRRRRRRARPAGRPRGRSAAAPADQRSWRSVPSSPTLSRTSGSASAGTPKRSHSHGSQPGSPRRCSCVRDAVEASVAKQAAEPVGQPGVDVAEPQRAAVARRLHLRHVLEQPRRACEEEKYGSSGRLLRRVISSASRREAVEDRLRALVLPDDDGGERLAGLGVPGEHRLALVVEPAGGDLAGRVREQLGDRVDDRVEDLVAVLLDPAGVGVARLLAPAGLLAAGAARSS